MSGKLSLEEFVNLFRNPRKDHPGRKDCVRWKGNIGKQVSGNSKWHRRQTQNGK